MTSPLTVKRNDYRQQLKRSDVYTPPAVAEFLYNILHRAERCEADRYICVQGMQWERPPQFADIFDPAIGTGCLTDPWYREGRIVRGCDVAKVKPACHGFILGRFEDQTKEILRPRPDLVLCNPPFNGAPSKQLYPEVFLRHVFELWGETIPTVLFVPMGFRLNQRKHSIRWRWLRDSQAEVASIVSLPLNTFSGVEFHAEILIFNIKGIRSHYFLPEGVV